MTKIVCTNCKTVTDNFYMNSPKKGEAQCVNCHENYVRRSSKGILHLLHGVNHTRMRGRARRKTNRNLMEQN